MSSQPSETQQKQDCLTCRVIGTAAFLGVGLYALQQSRAHQPGSPAAKRLMAGFGVAFLGLSYLRWNNIGLSGSTPSRRQGAFVQNTAS